MKVVLSTLILIVLFSACGPLQRRKARMGAVNACPGFGRLSPERLGKSRYLEGAGFRRLYLRDHEGRIQSVLFEPAVWADKIQDGPGFEYYASTFRLLCGRFPTELTWIPFVRLHPRRAASFMVPSSGQAHLIRQGPAKKFLLVNAEYFRLKSELPGLYERRQVLRHEVNTTRYQLEATLRELKSIDTIEPGLDNRMTDLRQRRFMLERRLAPLRALERKLNKILQRIKVVEERVYLEQKSIYTNQ